MVRLGSMKVFGSNKQVNKQIYEAVLNSYDHHKGWFPLGAKKRFKWALKNGRLALNVSTRNILSALLAPSIQI